MVAADPVVVLYGALNLQVRRLLRGPDAARNLERLLDLAEELEVKRPASRKW
jgi:hypothetical protein